MSLKEALGIPDGRPDCPKCGKRPRYIGSTAPRGREPIYECEDCPGHITPSGAAYDSLEEENAALRARLVLADKLADAARDGSASELHRAEKAYRASRSKEQT